MQGQDRYSAQRIPVCFLPQSHKGLLLALCLLDWCCTYLTPSWLAELRCTHVLPCPQSKGGFLHFCQGEVAQWKEGKESGQQVLHCCWTGGIEGNGEGMEKEPPTMHTILSSSVSLRRAVIQFLGHRHTHTKLKSYRVLKGYCSSLVCNDPCGYYLIKLI